MLSHDLQLLQKGAVEAQENVEKALLALGQISSILEGLVKDARAMENARIPMAMQLEEGDVSENIVVLNRWGSRP